MKTEQTYIVAVSGGVDSVVLLHKLVSRLEEARTSSTLNLKSPIYVVAHFDHGIREDSAEDAKLVKSLAKKYGLKFETESGRLGKDVSEANARDARYDFLERQRIKHKAEKIITAHHQDDLLETMVINLMRGTGIKGLVPFQRPNILRPLINKTKPELEKYAKDNQLEWREDSTNSDDAYLRNHVRHNIMPKLVTSRSKLLAIHRAAVKVNSELDYLTKLFLMQNFTGLSLNRYPFVIMPYIVQKQITYSYLFENGVKDIDKKMVERLTLAIKTMLPGKQTDVNGQWVLISEKSKVTLKSIS